MVDVTTFRTRYPEFTQESFNDTVVTTHLEESKTLLSVDKCGKKYELLIFLLMAHELKLKGTETIEAGVEISRSIEGGSRTLKNIATTDKQLYYSKTSYGQKYLAIKATIRFAGTVLCE